MRDNFLNIALREVGYKEGRNNDTKYGKWYGLNNQPWCAMFVSWCADQAKVLNKVIPKYAGCGTGYNWFKKHSSITKSPKAGDIGFLKATKEGATSSHTFIVYKVDGKTITTIEGNLNDRVIKNTRKLTDKNILGFGVCVWEEATKEEETKFKVGDKVVPTRLVNYNGTHLKQYDDYYYITELKGDRAVLSAKRNGKYVVWAAMNTADIKKV